MHYIEDIYHINATEQPLDIIKLIGGNVIVLSGAAAEIWQTVTDYLMSTDDDREEGFIAVLAIDPKSQDTPDMSPTIIDEVASWRYGKVLLIECHSWGFWIDRISSESPDTIGFDVDMIDLKGGGTICIGSDEISLWREGNSPWMAVSTPPFDKGWEGVLAKANQIVRDDEASISIGF